MQHRRKPFGRRGTPFAEFKSVEEEFDKGELRKRKERKVAIFVTPAVALGLALLLVASPETRALAIEMGGKVVDIGNEWLLRGTQH